MDVILFNTNMDTVVVEVTYKDNNNSSTIVTSYTSPNSISSACIVVSTTIKTTINIPPQSINDRCQQETL